MKHVLFTVLIWLSLSESPNSSALLSVCSPLWTLSLCPKAVGQWHIKLTTEKCWHPHIYSISPNWQWNTKSPAAPRRTLLNCWVTWFKSLCFRVNEVTWGTSSMCDYASWPLGERMGLCSAVRIRHSLLWHWGLLLLLFSHWVMSAFLQPHGTVACQTPLSMGFPRQEYRNGLPFPSPRDLPNPGIEPASPSLQVVSLPLSHEGSPVLRLLATNDQIQKSPFERYPCITGYRFYHWRKRIFTFWLWNFLRTSLSLLAPSSFANISSLHLISVSFVDVLCPFAFSFTLNDVWLLNSTLWLLLPWPWSPCTMMPWPPSGPSLEGNCIAPFPSPCVYVCVFMSVCMRERGRERERELDQHSSLYFFPSNHHVGLMRCLQDTPVSRKSES